MLKQLRNQKFAKRIFYVLAIIIVPSFIFWGSASVISDRKAKGQAGYAGRIFGKKVSFEEFMAAMYGWRNELRMKFGTQATQIESLFNPNEAVWYKLILLHEANRLKVKVTNEELTKHITSLPFLSRNGVFSSELYELFLKYSLSTPARVFEEQMRDSLKIQKLFEFVTDDLEVNADEIRDWYKQGHEQIKVKYISVLFQDLEKEISPAEQELREYYEENKDDFRIPIQINLSYVGIDYPDQATDEQRQSADEKIQKIHESVTKNGDLSKTRDEFGLQIKETGLFPLEETMPGFELDMNKIIELFNLKQGEISDIIQTAKGPYVFRPKEKLVNQLPEYKEAKEKVAESFIWKEARKLAQTRIEDYASKIQSKKEANQNLSLEQIAVSLNLPVKETEFFDRKSLPKEIGDAKDLSDIAFDLKEGEISKPLEFSQGYCIVGVSELKPIDEEVFQQEKDSLRDVVLAEKRDKAFEQYFDKLKEQSGLVDYIPTQQAQKQPAEIN